MKYTVKFKGKDETFWHQPSIRYDSYQAANDAAQRLQKNLQAQGFDMEAMAVET